MDLKLSFFPSSSFDLLSEMLRQTKCTKECFFVLSYASEVYWVDVGMKSAIFKYCPPE